MKEQREVGRPKKRESSQLFSLRLPIELHGALRVYAAAQRQSLNDVLLKMIDESWHRIPDRAAFERLANKAQG